MKTMKARPVPEALCNTAHMGQHAPPGTHVCTSMPPGRIHVSAHVPACCPGHMCANMPPLGTCVPTCPATRTHVCTSTPAQPGHVCVPAHPSWDTRMCQHTAPPGHTCAPAHSPHTGSDVCTSTPPARTHTCASTGHSRMHTHTHAPCGKARAPSWVRLRWPRLIRAVLPQTVGAPLQEGPCPLSHRQWGTRPWPGAQEPV